MIARFNGNVVPFADDATSTNRTVFGGTTQSDLIDDNLNTNFKKGWEIVGLNDNPTREDFNAMGYTLGALISYLYEMGISEWNTSQNYRVNSRAIGSDGNLYKSLTGTIGTPNAGNNPLSDVVNWKSLEAVSLTGDQTIAGIKTFSSFPITPSSAPTTNYQVANKKYVDDRTVASSETVAGVIELATAAEAQAGTDDLRAITPLKLRNALNASGTAPIYACRAWVNFNGTGTVAIRASGNVSSITDNGVGIYTVNFTTAMADKNYVCVEAQPSNMGSPTGNALQAGFNTPSTTSVMVTSESSGNGQYIDKDTYSFAVIR